jgi:ribulose-phosphate 3-epimerase
MKTIKIAPSILGIDFALLGEEIKHLMEAGANLLHLDVMDGNFVPTITFGAELVQNIRKIVNLPLDVHLMVQEPERQIRLFAEAGSDTIIVHLEAMLQPIRTLQLIRSLGIKAGLALNPGSNEDVLKYLLDYLDVVLIMTVEPGSGGQKFLLSQLKKIENVHHLIGDRPVDLEVDGGINRETAVAVVKAGANVLVSGSYVIKHPEGYKNGINSLRSQIEY